MSILILKLNTKRYLCNVEKKIKTKIIILINKILHDLHFSNKKFTFANINESWKKIFYDSCTLMFF